MPLLVLLFIVLPIAELYVIIQIGGAIGVLPTLALLIVDSIIGAALARSQSRAAWERFNRALGAGRVPGREVFDGAMIILGGALLLTPGFITDAFGLFLLIPPTRALLRRFLTRSVSKRAGAAWKVTSFGSARAGAARRGPVSYDYEGSAREVAEDPPRAARDQNRRREPWLTSSRSSRRTGCASPGIARRSRRSRRWSPAARPPSRAGELEGSLEPGFSALRVITGATAEGAAARAAARPGLPAPRTTTRTPSRRCS